MTLHRHAHDMSRWPRVLRNAVLLDARLIALAFWRPLRQHQLRGTMLPLLTVWFSVYQRHPVKLRAFPDTVLMINFEEQSSALRPRSQ